MPQAQAFGVDFRSLQAYLLSLYFDCPEFAGFHCPNETAKEVQPQSLECIPMMLPKWVLLMPLARALSTGDPKHLSLALSREFFTSKKKY